MTITVKPGLTLQYSNQTDLATIRRKYLRFTERMQAKEAKFLKSIKSK